MRLSPSLRFFGTLLGLTLAASSSAGDAEAEAQNPPLLTVRSRDRVTINVRRAYLTFSETIVLTPAEVKNDRLRPGAINRVNLLIAPFWFKDGLTQGPAFPVLRPQVTPSHGRVQRFALVTPNGETVRSIDDITPECRYVLTLEFGHMLPDELTVTVMMSSPLGINPGAELSYTPSNDGHPFRSGPPSSFQTAVHIIADPDLEPWKVTKGTQVISRRDNDVILERDTNHTFRFAPTAD